MHLLRSTTRKTVKAEKTHTKGRLWQVERADVALAQLSLSAELISPRPFSRLKLRLESKLLITVLRRYLRNRRAHNRLEVALMLGEITLKTLQTKIVLLVM